MFRSFVPGGDMPVHTQRRILFLSYLYFIITITDMSRYATFVHITKLPKLLWDLSSCLDLQFNLKKFHTDFSTIFNDGLLTPLPPQTPPQPPLQHPLPTPTPSPLPSQHPLPTPTPSPSSPITDQNHLKKFFNY